MERYVKKPIVVEAERWFKVTYDREAGHGFGTSHNPIYHLDVGYFRRPDVYGQSKCKHCGFRMHDHGWMDTLEGGHNVCPGDWIIRGIAGEMYPCKPDIFEATYDLFESPTNRMEVLDEDVASAAPVLDLEKDVGSFAPSVDDTGTGCYDELVYLGFDERNPAYYCQGFECGKYLGHRGFCSDKCHNDFYDDMCSYSNAELETLEILSDKDCMAGIIKSVSEIQQGRTIPLSELYPNDTRVSRIAWGNEYA